MFIFLGNSNRRPRLVGGELLDYTDVNKYRVHSFKSELSQYGGYTDNTFKILYGSVTVTYLICGGGGAGGSAGYLKVGSINYNCYGGGGGAGGYLFGTTTLAPGTYTARVGQGGVVSQNGVDSVLLNNAGSAIFRAYGGGRGASWSGTTRTDASPGGSGGGGAAAGNAGGAGTVGQGNAGGTGSSYLNEFTQTQYYYGSGGGGARTAGGTAAGGSGTAITITGGSVVYSEGGARGTDFSFEPAPNLGNGGQGGTNGGSGIIILREILI